MPDAIRPLTADDAPAAWALGSLAFGYHDQPMPDGWGAEAPGRRSWGVFDPQGRMIGKAIDREQAHWFGGRVVPASGVAGVAVAAEQRGAGTGRAVLTRLLADAHDRGAVISTLFDTTPVPYRRLGWEEVGALVKTAIPTAAFGGPRPQPGLRTRPATDADLPTIEALYRAVAGASTGMIERTGPVYGPMMAGLLADWDGVTVAVDGDTVVGYASWDRGSGYDANGRVRVGDLIGLSPPATAALLGVLGGWASVAPTIVLRQPEGDPVHLLAGGRGLGTVEQRQPWMLRVIDAAGAVAARGWSPYLRGEVGLEIVDPECPWQTGRYRLAVADGVARLEPGGPGGATFGPRGLALWYAGAATPDTLRRAGLLRGDPAGDGLLQAATAGPPPTLLDYF